MLRSVILALCFFVLLHNIKCEEAKHTRPGEADISASKHTKDDGSHDDSYDHDAVVGSHKGAEEFKELSPEESKNRLGVLVSRMDSDGNGKVDKNELVNWIVESFKNLDREDAKTKMEEHDENDDKKVSWNEYLHKGYGYKPEEIDAFEKDKTPDMQNFLKMLKEDQKKFDTADENKDGFLDLEEYTHFTHPHNYDKMAPVEIARTMDDYDKNKDGFIDLSEFMGDGSPYRYICRHTYTWPRGIYIRNSTSKSRDKMDAETKKAEAEHFQQYDVNKDGKLSPEEVKAWVMPKFHDSAVSEAEHLIKESDKDKDGVLSKDEIINNHELWVGSTATDYGKHLDDLKKDEL